jgi:programmed cell death 6-interacting protein
MKDPIIAKLSSQCEEYYANALKLVQKDVVRNIWDRDWIPLVQLIIFVSYSRVEHLYCFLLTLSDRLLGSRLLFMV